MRVLVVDDDADTLEYIATVLQGCEAVVKTVTSAQSALAAIAQFKPDVMLSDIGMPDIDGYSLIQAVRAIAPSQGDFIPAAALTAYARPEDRTQALQAGFQMYLSKPVEPAELLTVVANLAAIANCNFVKNSL